MNITTLHDFSYYYGGGYDGPVHVVREYLGDDATPDQLTAVTRSYVSAINDALARYGITLRGVVFFVDLDVFGHTGDVEAATDEVITMVLGDVDLIAAAELADNSRKTGETQG